MGGLMRTKTERADVWSATAERPADGLVHAERH
jgi:hypothetical protein